MRGELKRVAKGALAALGLQLRRLPGDPPDLYAEYTAATLARRPFLNVGAGDFRHPHWTNLDFGSDWYRGHQTHAYVEYDLTAGQPLPFPDASIELVYSSHTIEHVRDDAVARLLAEVRRVLRPGGGIRITCPDAELLLRTVAHDRLSWWSWREPWFSGPLSTVDGLERLTPLDCLVREICTGRSAHYVHARDPHDPAQVRAWYQSLEPRAFLDKLVEGLEFDPRFPGDHINWWDDSKLLAALRAAGFEHAYRSRPGQSLFLPLTDARYFDATRPNMSLFVEAVR